MKKLIITLAMILSACGNQQVVETSESEPAKSELAERPDAPSTEEMVTAQNDKENPIKVEDSKTKEDESSITETSEQNTKTEEVNELEPAEASIVSNSDYFYLPKQYLVRASDNNTMVDELAEPLPTESTPYYSYVKYSNNLYIRRSEDFSHELVRVVGDEIASLYTFPAGEEFIPIGLIEEKVYGYHNYYEDGNPLEDKSALAVLDLGSGELNDYGATRGIFIRSAQVSKGELLFVAAQTEPAESYNLYRLDLSQGFDQDIEFMTKHPTDFKLYGQKQWVGGEPTYTIFAAMDGQIDINDKVYKMLEGDALWQDFIGNNIFTFTYNPTYEDDKIVDPYIIHLKITNISTDENIFDQDIRGYKILKGKMYYLDTNTEVKSLDLDL